MASLDEPLPTSTRLPAGATGLLSAPNVPAPARPRWGRRAMAATTVPVEVTGG